MNLSTIRTFLETRTTLVIVCAWIISVCIKLLFLIHVANHPHFCFEGLPLPLWTQDAGLYGHYAGLLKSNVVLPFGAETMPGRIIYWAHLATGASLDTLIFWLPTLLSSLIVVPIVLMGNLHKVLFESVVAAIITTLIIGYYSRTHFGYYDTDICNLLFPTFMIYGMMLVSTNRRLLGIVITSISSLGFYLWYHSFESISAALLGGYFLYVLIFDRKNSFHYLNLICAGVVFLPIEIVSKFVVVVLCIGILHPIASRTNYLYWLVVIFLGIGATGFWIDTSILYARAIEYFNKQPFLDSPTGLNFLNTLSVVSEAKPISFNQWGIKVANHFWIAIIGSIGYGILCLKKTAFLLFLPLYILGIASMFAGARFSYYGVLPVAMGLSYVAFQLNVLIFKSKAQHLKPVIGIALIGYYVHGMYQYTIKIPPIMDQADVTVISKLPNNSPFVMAWWDYGWPLWYYGKARTLVDNGNHLEDTYLVSRLLFETHPEFIANASKNIALLLPIIRESGQLVLSRALFQNKEPEQAMKELYSAHKGESEDVYWFLHLGMLSRLNTIHSYSNYDLKTSARTQKHISRFLPKHSIYSFNKEDGLFHAKGLRYPIISYHHQPSKTSKTYAHNGIFHLIEGDSFFFLCNDIVLNSFVIKGLLLDNLNPDFFEVVERSPSSVLIKIPK